ncbi:MAG: hypothetical protein RJA22_2312 [Verrucomicrobiota bacterium]
MTLPLPMAWFRGWHLWLLLWSLALSVSAAESRAKPRVLFLVGDEEYRTGETVPAWARAELAGQVECDFVIDDPKGPAVLRGLERLPRAQALFLSLKRRALEPAQLERIRAHVAAGKPVLGIRTASHAFGARQPEPGRLTWDTFDRDVWGGHYQNHYGKGPATLVRLAAGAAGHPVAEGWPAGEVRFSSHLYRCRDLGPGTRVLLDATVEGQPDIREPAAWIRTDGGRRHFYTSLGSPEDFREPAFRRLLAGAVRWAVSAGPGAAAGPGRP